jgi:ribose transport system substrate-binding protein
MNRTRTKQYAVLIGLVMVLALALTACGGGSKSSSGGGDETASRGAVAKYEKELAATYKGDFEAPQGEPVTPPKGKSIWVITTGQNIETSQNISAAIEEAGEKLGWTVHIFDGKFESSRQLTGIQQALAAKADGIITFAIDCAPIKAGLEQAKAAGVPVVSVEGKACEPTLSSYDLTFARRQNFQQWIENGFAGYQAKWIVAKTGGQAKTIVTVETDLFVTRIALPGIERVFDTCPTCEIVDVVNFVGTEFGPPLQAKIEQALNQHPEANSFLAAYDAVMTGGGGAAALRASGRESEIEIMGGEGSAPGIELIYNKAGSDACSGINFQWEGYAALMGLTRVLAGQDPYKENTGIGSQVCDLEHNLPPKGEAYQPPIEFIPAYEEMWGLK